jgi:hypothetical protein
MKERLPYPDLGAHEPGCIRIDSLDEPIVDPISRSIDIFCECHRYTEPKVLMNGTDIAWPAGWTLEQAYDWRRQHDLSPPAPVGA